MTVRLMAWVFILLGVAGGAGSRPAAWAGQAKDPSVLDLPVLPTVSPAELSAFAASFVPAVLAGVEWPGAGVVEQGQTVTVVLKWVVTEPLPAPLTGVWRLFDGDGEAAGTLECGQPALAAGAPGEQRATVELFVPERQLPGRFMLRLLLAAEGAVSLDWTGAYNVREISVLARLHRTGADRARVAALFGERAAPLGVSATLAGEGIVRLTVPAGPGKRFVILSNLPLGNDLPQGAPVATVRARCPGTTCPDIVLRAGVHTAAANHRQPVRHRLPRLAWAEAEDSAVWWEELDSRCLSECQEWTIAAAPGAAFHLADIVELGAAP